MNNQKLTLPYAITCISAVILTWIIHEFTHWFTSELLGFETIMRLNGTAPIDGKNMTASQSAVISISAPIITILQAVLAFLILRLKQWNKYLYPFLFTAFYMRFFAGIMNFIMPNGEACVGQYLGIGTHTLSFLISVFLFYLVYIISKKYKLKSKFQIWTISIVLVTSWLLIIADQFFKIRLI